MDKNPTTKDFAEDYRRQQARLDSHRKTAITILKHHELSGETRCTHLPVLKYKPYS